MYVCPHNTRTKMYAGRVECCPLVSHVEYALDGTDRRTDGRQTVTLRLTLDTASVIKI